MGFHRASKCPRDVDGRCLSCITTDAKSRPNLRSLLVRDQIRDLQPRPIKHAHIGFRVAPGGPAVAGRRTNAPPRRTGVPAAGEPKIGPGVRFFFDHPVACRKGCKTLRYFTLGFLLNPTSERNPCREARDGPLWSRQFVVALSISNDGMQLPCSMTL